MALSGNELFPGETFEFPPKGLDVKCHIGFECAVHWDNKLVFTPYAKQCFPQHATSFKFTPRLSFPRNNTLLGAARFFMYTWYIQFDKVRNVYSRQKHGEMFFTVRVGDLYIHPKNQAFQQVMKIKDFYKMLSNDTIGRVFMIRNTKPWRDNIQRFICEQEGFTCLKIEMCYNVRLIIQASPELFVDVVLHNDLTVQDIIYDPLKWMNLAIQFINEEDPPVEFHMESHWKPLKNDLFNRLKDEQILGFNEKGELIVKEKYRGFVRFVIKKEIGRFTKPPPQDEVFSKIVVELTNLIDFANPRCDGTFADISDDYDDVVVKGMPDIEDMASMDKIKKVAFTVFPLCAKLGRSVMPQNCYVQ